jgi:DNA-directed RNA polymerase subunit RPC12/RpoP
MGSATTTVKCAGCLTILDDRSDVPVSERRPCPSCGSRVRLFEDNVIETSELRDSMGMKARHGTTGRPFFEAKAGADLHRKSGKWMHRDLMIDHDNDRYVERVIDPATGAVVHECEEPLSQHGGHGDAKRRHEGNDG